MRISRHFCVALVALVVASELSAQTPSDHLKAIPAISPAETITGDNVGSNVDMLTPGVRWAIERGLRFEVVEPRRIEPPRAYTEATRKHPASVKLVKDGKELEGYVAGQPFPAIDAADPDAAFKILWNVEHNFRGTDDLAAQSIVVKTGPIAGGQPMRVERRYVIDAYRKLSYVGRLYVDPKPELPNEEGYQFKESIRPIIEPADFRGLGFLSFRYLSAVRQDDNWLNTPALRHTRRIYAVQRSDSLFGQDIDIDSLWGFNCKLALVEPRLLGETTILLPMHGRHSPARWHEPEDWFFDDTWEPRRVWVIEATQIFSQYSYGKRILYVDQESYLMGASDIYSRSGQHWKTWIGLYRFSRESRPGATLGRYEEDMPLLQAAVMIDLLLARATTVAIPSATFPSNEGWLVNRGDAGGTTEDFFTLARLFGAQSRLDHGTAAKPTGSK